MEAIPLDSLVHPLPTHPNPAPSRQPNVRKTTPSRRGKRSSPLLSLHADLPSPVPNHHTNSSISSLSEGRSETHSHRRFSLPDSLSEGRYVIPENYANLNELVALSPIENPNEAPLYPRYTLELSRSNQRRALDTFYDDVTEYSLAEPEQGPAGGSLRKAEQAEKADRTHKISQFATQLYTVSYLIFFSFLGTLARLGLQGMTLYTGAPILFPVLWANVAGCVIMGFLAEDRMLFRDEWGTPTYHQQIEATKNRSRDEEIGLDTAGDVDLQAAKKAYVATKKTIPLYIGLATGFCGCFTSFASSMRDSFLALSNELVNDGPRNGGYSLMAFLAVIITTVTMSIGSLYFGAHIAIALQPYIPILPFKFTRKVLDPVMVIVAWGCWIGAIFLAIFTPDRFNPPSDNIMRGRAVFAMVFSPVGCLGRFYLSLYLNGKIASFPLGTFVANIFGTAVLGMSYDLQHSPVGGLVGCQVLQGIESGFCGCMTTISTWVSELTSLRRMHAYRYAAISVTVGISTMIVIMGSMQWTVGFSELICRS